MNLKKKLGHTVNYLLQPCRGYLTRLINRNILHKEQEINGHTFYSLIEEFNDSLNLQRKHYPTGYLEKTLSLHNFDRSSEFGSSISQF